MQTRIWFVGIVSVLLFSAETSAQGASPLAVVERTTAIAAGAQSGLPSKSSPQRQERWTLQHTGEVPIVGWRLGCVYGLRDGRSATVSVGADSFGPSVTDPLHPFHEQSLLRPGETVSAELPTPPARESSLEVWSCGPTAVIFADTTTWGAPQALERMFERRRHEVRDALRLLAALDALERRTAAGSRHRVEPDEVRAALESALPEDRWGRYRTEVAAATAEATTTTGTDALEALGKRVEVDVEHMLRQLRAEDLRRLGEGEPEAMR